MADENRMITFEYARTTWDQFKKQTIPSNNKCMTKAEINQYLNAESAPLTNYVNDRLVPRSMFVGLSGFNIGSGFNNTVNTIAIQSDGKILVGGTFTTYNGVASTYTVRLNYDGSKDASFNIGTWLSVIIYPIAIQSDGKILVGGIPQEYNATRFRRLNNNGQEDDLFISNEVKDNSVRAISIQSDGKILVGSELNSSAGISLLRLNTNGSKDSTFTTASFPTTHIFSVQIQSDGKILVGGVFTTYNGVASKNIIRLNSNGTIDTTFNVGTGFNGGSILCITTQSDGKILAGGGFNGYNGVTSPNIIRINPNGTPDTTFNVGTGFNGWSRAIAIQSDGKILVGGTFPTYKGVASNNIIRLNSDGSKDTTFNVGTGFNDTVNTITIQSDGKILVGGVFTTYNGVASNRIIRLNSNGSINQ